MVDFIIQDNTFVIFMFDSDRDDALTFNASLLLRHIDGPVQPNHFLDWVPPPLDHWPLVLLGVWEVSHTLLKYVDPMPKVPSVQPLEIVGAAIPFVVLIARALEVQIKYFITLKDCVSREWFVHVRYWDSVLLHFKVIIQKVMHKVLGHTHDLEDIVDSWLEILRATRDTLGLLSLYLIYEIR